MMDDHIKFTADAIAAITFMLSTGNIADAKKYLFALLESGIQRTQEQQTRLDELFAACYR